MILKKLLENPRLPSWKQRIILVTIGSFLFIPLMYLTIIASIGMANGLMLEHGSWLLALLPIIFWKRYMILVPDKNASLSSWIFFPFATTLYPFIWIFGNHFLWQSGIRFHGIPNMDCFLYGFIGLCFVSTGIKNWRELIINCTFFLLAMCLMLPFTTVISLDLACKATHDCL